jgi:hypothetical protein
LRELAIPLVRWLNDNFNPHYEIRITGDAAQLLLVEASAQYQCGFIKD